MSSGAPKVTGIRKPGEFCWINMLTPQPAEAREFFGKVLGWTYFEMPGIGHGIKVGGRDIGGLFGWTAEAMPAAVMNYTVFKREGVPVAGMLQITPQMGNMPPHWATYFTVKDADEALGETVKLGGKVCMTMKEVAGVGRFCGM